MAGGVVMDAAAEYIGVSETALMSERHDGKSLAQIAVEHGKTAAGLEQTLVAAFKANSNTAVAAGRITADQAAQGARDLPVAGADDDRSHGDRADGRPRCRDGAWAWATAPEWVSAWAEAGADPPGRMTGRASTVLVVEDERKLRDLLRGYLEREGLGVLTTGSGAEAIALVRESGPDLVILDLGLPDVSGEEVAREVRHVL